MTTAAQPATVTSDHIDPATLDTTGGTGGSGTPLVQVFTLNGTPNLDPLANGSAPMNELGALSIPAVYRGVSFIAQTIAHLPKRVYQRTGTGPSRLDDHPANWPLNDEPNPLQTPATFWSTFLLHAIAWSNGFAAIRREPGADTELYTLPPDRMIPFRFQGRQWYAYDTEAPKNGNTNSRFLIFGADEILHLPALSFDGMQGMGLIKLMAPTLRTSKATESYVGRYYTQGGMMGGALETDAKLTKEQITELIDLIRNNYSGNNQAHKWMVLANGMHAKTLAAALDTAQTEENRKFSVLEIARMLGVPPHLLYELGRATWSNIESLGIEVVKYTLNNWIVPLEQEITRKLLTRAERKAGHYVRFDTSALLRGDHAAQIDAATKRTQNGLTTPDEERAVWELPPLANGAGATAHIPANTLPLTQPATPPAPATTPGEVEEDLQRKPTAADFAGLFAEAAHRVEAKTAKAVEAHKGKSNWTPWSNAFAGEQETYSSTTIGPIIDTLHHLTGQPATGEAAAKIGAAYGQALRQHFAALNRGADSTPPNLNQIIMETLK